MRPQPEDRSGSPHGFRKGHKAARVEGPSTVAVVGPEAREPRPWMVSSSATMFAELQIVALRHGSVVVRWMDDRAGAS